MADAVATAGATETQSKDVEGFPDHPLLSAEAQMIIEHLEFVPVRFIDDVIAVANKTIHESMKPIERAIDGVSTTSQTAEQAAALKAKVLQVVCQF